MDPETVDNPMQADEISFLDDISSLDQDLSIYRTYNDVGIYQAEL
jgi:hypothetical protein